jgi:hypothetical protein
MKEGGAKIVDLFVTICTKCLSLSPESNLFSGLLLQMWGFRSPAAPCLGELFLPQV